MAQLPTGSTVFSNPDTERAVANMAAGGGGGSWDGVVRLEISSADSEAVAWLRKIVRVRGGGSVQTALGYGG
jgi:hypothetical protein